MYCNIRFACTFILLLVLLQSSGQDSFYKHISFGKYEAGYCDSVLYNDSIAYSAFSYRGASPMFVQIWHPLKKRLSGKALTYGDLKTIHVPADLKQVYDALISKSDTVFMDDNISYTITDDEAIDYGNSTIAEVLHGLQSYETYSYYSQLPKASNFPVIVYHHGAQSLSSENFIMAEYFASQGYIFVAANFHLPYPGMPIGSAPFLSNTAFQNDLLSVKKLMQFAKSLTTNRTTFFVGHSWGAQSGWSFLYEKGWADAFVSMETTLEDKKDSVKIKQVWPELYDLIKTKNTRYSLPILLFAGTEEDKPFHFFENAAEKRMVFVAPKTAFSHNSYTSVFLLRYFFRDQYSQPDTALVKSQIDLYLQHLKMMKDFFIATEHHKQFNAKKYTDKFYINYSRSELINE